MSVFHLAHLFAVESHEVYHQPETDFIPKYFYLIKTDCRIIIRKFLGKNNAIKRKENIKIREILYR